MPTTKIRSELTLPKIPDALRLQETLPPFLHQFDAMQIRWQLVPVVFVDQETWNIVMANRPAEELFGFNLGEMVGMSVHELVPESVRAKHMEHVKAFADEPYQTARPMGQGLIVLGRHRKGHEFPCNVALYRFVHGGHRFVLAEIVDMRTGLVHHAESR